MVCSTKLSNQPKTSLETSKTPMNLDQPKILKPLKSTWNHLKANPSKWNSSREAKSKNSSKPSNKNFPYRFRTNSFTSTVNKSASFHPSPSTKNKLFTSLTAKISSDCINLSKSVSKYWLRKILALTEKSMNLFCLEGTKFLYLKVSYWTMMILEILIRGFSLTFCSLAG